MVTFRNVFNVNNRIKFISRLNYKRKKLQLQEFLIFSCCSLVFYNDFNSFSVYFKSKSKKTETSKITYLNYSNNTSQSIRIPLRGTQKHVTARCYLNRKNLNGECIDERHIFMIICNCKYQNQHYKRFHAFERFLKNTT